MKYSVTVEEKLRNYVIGHSELGLDLEPVLRHFSEYLPQDRVIAITEQALGIQWTTNSETTFLSRSIQYRKEIQVSSRFCKERVSY